MLNGKQSTILERKTRGSMVAQKLAELHHRVRYGMAIFEPSAFALKPFRCALCGPSLLVRLARTPIGVRCANCGASAITLSLASALKEERPSFRRERVYELSSRGPLFQFLRRQVKDLTFSEYLDDVEPGLYGNGVQCQDVRQLTYPDAVFDIVTSTEVFEHVPDDVRGFAQVFRVLRPGGLFVFTVPIEASDKTIERAMERDGKVEHLKPAAYHDDRIRGRGKVLVFRDYGRDITERLLRAGFSDARIDSRWVRAFFGAGREVLVAYRR
jgi:SAM-dependent methyltransferase